MVDGLTVSGNGASESLGGFAKLVGVSKQAVSKAIARGRLKHSIGRDANGRPMIANVALAHQEWSANAAKPIKGGGAATRQADRPAGSVPVAPPADDDDDVPEPDPIDVLADAPIPNKVKNLADAQLIATIERAKTLRLARDVKIGRLVEKDAVVRQQFEAMRIVREGMLNLPARLAAELAAETEPAKVFSKLDAAIRSALSGVAGDLRAKAGEAAE